MAAALDMEKKQAGDDMTPVDTASDIGTTQAIYIDPEKERAAFRKFDLFVFPVSVIFMVLSSLDRNNVSTSEFPNSVAVDPCTSVRGC
jgi:hypothetical protein